MESDDGTSAVAEAMAETGAVEVLLELLRSHQVLHNCIQTFTKLTCSEPKAVYEPAQQHDY